MKKTAVAVLGLFVLSSLGFAGAEGKFEGKKKDMTPEQKAQWEAVKKEKADYQKNLQALVDKFNKVSEKDKPAVKNEITNLVSKQTDRDIAALRERAAKMEADKAAVVSKKVDFVLSPEGQEKMQKMKDKKGKKEKSGKEFKKPKAEKKVK